MAKRSAGGAGPFVKAAIRDINLGLDGGYSLDRLTVRAGVLAMAIEKGHDLPSSWDRRFEYASRAQSYANS